ncbi:ZIP zinc transporter-domain-containing protein [Sparassis latifolia]
MLVLEQLLSPRSHAHPQPAPPPSPKPAAQDVQFDVELGELERAEGIDIDWDSSTAAAAARAAKSPEGASSAESIARAYPLTLGLVLHALADGLALGASALSSGAGVSAVPSRLSLVVFLALVVHKAPTALALTTSLLATALPRAQCKIHLAVFSAATPVGALVSYVFLSILGAHSEGRWPGIALLVSGGTFLYVATVVQPVRGSSADGLGTKTRTLLIVLGMVIPFAVGAVLGHGHGR